MFVVESGSVGVRLWGFLRSPTACSRSDHVGCSQQKNYIMLPAARTQGEPSWQ